MNLLLINYYVIIILIEIGFNKDVRLTKNYERETFHDVSVD